MPDNFSEHINYYILLALFALLFVLQVWAMLKIKQMLQHVLDIYRRMQQMAALQKFGEAQPSPKLNVKYKRICEYCRHRETFLDASGKNVFVYQCGLSKQKIKLEDSCAHFGFDPQRAQI
jgi:type IV secretory pathway component VirB8